MSSRLNELINRKKISGDKLLSIFVTAGFPEKDATEDIILTLAQTGVDFIELGMPFSDPIADGPVIQEASQKALENGVTINRVFEILKKVRSKSDIPVLLMGYLNPVLRYGLDKFLHKSAETGVDGLILPDWPLEENGNYTEQLQALDLDLIHLVAPNTPKDRIMLIDQQSTSFIYCVAYTGVTGLNSHITDATVQFLTFLKNNLKHPFIVGFGVKNHDDFTKYTQYADGVIIGSAFIKLLENTKIEKREQAVSDFVRQIKK